MVASDEFFAKVEARLGKVDKAKRDPQMLRTYKFKVTDDAGNVIKTWFLDLVNVAMEVADKDAECTFIASDSDLVDFGNQKFTLEEAVEQGKLKVEGNKDYAKLLKPFLATL